MVWYPERVLTYDSVARTIVKYERIVLIDPLPDDVFLEIFDFFCLYDFTEYPVQRMKWLILAHVCQRWRRIIFASPRRLDLYLSCICGTPVQTESGLLATHLASRRSLPRTHPFL